VNIFALEIFDDEGAFCTFYTVRWDDATESETDKFFSKFENDPRLNWALQELSVLLTKVIGNKTGALDDYFRFENEAQALPPKREVAVDSITLNYNEFPLRLYCLRVTEEIVVLFNGGEKTSQSAQDGSTSMVFYEANLFAKRIHDALHDGYIQLTPDGRKIVMYDHSKDILL
jgi:hypothetical protein